MGIRPGGRPTEPLQPRLLEVTWPRGARRELRWRTDPARMSSAQADQEFTAASWSSRGTLLQPTHTEILEIDPARWTVTREISHPLMHSVHNVVERPGGGLVVSCAGNDSVLELDPRGELIAHHWLRGDRSGFAAAYPGITDFRRAHHDRFKPHSHHPNHAFYVDDELWVTCFEQRAALSLSRPGRRIPFTESIPHDGRRIPHDGRGGLLWFTLVDGWVIAVDPETLERRVVIDLNTLDPRPQMLGWCRGVEVVGDRLFVGMTMLRRTRHREVLRVLLRGERGRKLPTRIVEVDLGERRIVGELEVGNAAGGTIYGLLKSP